MQGEKEAQNIADVRSTHFKLHAKKQVEDYQENTHWKLARNILFSHKQDMNSPFTENHTATCVTLRCNLYHFTMQYDADCTVIPVTSQRNMTQIAK